IENVARTMELFVRRIVVVSEEIVCLDNIDIMNLRRLQNFTRTLRAGDVRACAHLSPAIECARNTDLRPDAENRRHSNVVKETVTPESDWIEHARGNLLA